MRALLVIALVLVAASAPAGENVCVQCHESLSGRSGAPVAAWRGSVHAENAVFCNGCHGGDPDDPPQAMNPARGFIGVPRETAIPKVCGACHIGILRDYLQSLHGKALGKGGPTCATCHGSHGIRRATLDLINPKDCSRCHDYARAARLREVMAGLEQELVATATRLEGLRNRGVRTEDLEQRLFSARNRFHTLFHDVDVEKVARAAAGIRSEIAPIPAWLDRYEDRLRGRRLAGLVAVSAALVAALLFHLLRRTHDP